MSYLQDPQQITQIVLSRANESFQILKGALLRTGKTENSS